MGLGDTKGDHDLDNLPYLPKPVTALCNLLAGPYIRWTPTQ